MALEKENRLLHEKVNSLEERFRELSISKHKREERKESESGEKEGVADSDRSDAALVAGRGDDSASSTAAPLSLPAPSPSTSGSTFELPLPLARYNDPLVPEAWLNNIWKKYKGKGLRLSRVLLESIGEKDGPFLVVNGQRFPMSLLLPFTFHRVKVQPKLAKEWVRLLCHQNLDAFFSNPAVADLMPWYKLDI